MLPRLEVDRASKSGVQRCRSGCLVLGMWGVRETKRSNAMQKRTQQESCSYAPQLEPTETGYLQ